MGTNWNQIGRHFKDKPGKCCRERWVNQLDPSINREPFSAEEEWTLYLGVTLYGTKWCEISSMFTNRPDKQIKNYWNSASMKRRVE